MSVQLFKKCVGVEDGGFAYRVEKHKAVQAYALAQDSDLFYTPKLIESDDVSGTLLFEHLGDMRTLREHCTRADWNRAAKALAFIHGNIELPSDLKTRRAGSNSTGPEVVLHADFWPGNCAQSAKGFTIFDWGFRAWWTEKFTVGSPAVDLATFLAYWILPVWQDLRFPVAGVKDFLLTYRDHCLPEIKAGCSVDEILKSLSDESVYVCKELNKRRGLARCVHGVKYHVNQRRLLKAVVDASD